MEIFLFHLNIEHESKHNSWLWIIRSKSYNAFYQTTVSKKCLCILKDDQEELFGYSSPIEYVHYLYTIALSYYLVFRFPSFCNSGCGCIRYPLYSMIYQGSLYFNVSDPLSPLHLCQSCFSTFTKDAVLEKYLALASCTFFSAACGFTISRPCK